MMRERKLVYGAAGCVFLLLLWEFIGRESLIGDTLPAFTAVLSVYTQHYRRALLLRSAALTVTAAVTGFSLGAAAGILVALAAHLVPSMRSGLDRMAVLVNAMPILALGPVLIITIGREGTPAALASVPVFFLIYMAFTTGLRSANQRLHLVLTTLGASRWQRLVRLEAVAAVPHLLNGIKLAAGSAMIGAVVGEWFGAPAGLGIVVLNSMQNFQISLMWAAVLVIALITLASYALLGVIERTVRGRMS